MRTNLEMLESRIHELSQELSKASEIIKQSYAPPPPTSSLSTSRTPATLSRHNSSVRSNSGNTRSMKGGNSAGGAGGKSAEKLDSAMADRILNEVVVNGSAVSWDDIGE